MSVDSGLTGPMEAPSASTVPRSSAPTEPRRRGARRGPAAADALADAVSTPSFRSSSSRRPRRRGRRVTRIVRRIELWSVLKIGLVFNTIMLGVALGSVAILWGLANTTGLIDDFEGFLQDAGFEDFRFQGDQMFQQVAFIGAVGALAATIFMVLSAALLNLISELTGGIRFTVIEEIVDDAPMRLAPPALALPVVPSAPVGPPAPPVRGPGAPLPAGSTRPSASSRPGPPVGVGGARSDDRTAVAPAPDDTEEPDAEAKATPKRSTPAKRASGPPPRKRVTPTQRSKARGTGGPSRGPRRSDDA